MPSPFYAIAKRPIHPHETEEFVLLRRAYLALSRNNLRYDDDRLIGADIQDYLTRKEVERATNAPAQA